MNIKIICIGKLKEKYLMDGIIEYSKRISKYCNLNIMELPDQQIPNNTSLADIEIIKKSEAIEIEKNINSKDYTICLDSNGKTLSSNEFADKISTTLINGYSTITFIIGGSLGLSHNLILKCNLSLSFSKLTFPHQLFRLILLEQIYRCFKINNNETYHK